jgi:DNA polymerase III alpha subunit (gram-positive type)
MERRSFNNKPDRLVFLDIETTGLNPFSNEIIEIAVKDNIGNQWQTLIKPTYKLPQKIVDITKITDTMIDREGISICEGLNKMIDFIEGKNLNCVSAKWIIGHNLIGFDWAFLFNSCKRNKIILPSYIRLLDTYRIAQYLLTKNEYQSYKLANLCEQFGIKCQGYHRAMNDVCATEKLFNELVNRVKNGTMKYLWDNTTVPFI